MNTPKWVTDLMSYVDSIPYGESQVTISRVGNRTVQLQANSVETVRYETTEEAMADITKLIKALGEAKIDGTATFQLTLKDGTIKEIGYYNVKQTKY